MMVLLLLRYRSRCWPVGVNGGPCSSAAPLAHYRTDRTKGRLVCTALQCMALAYQHCSCSGLMMTSKTIMIEVRARTLCPPDQPAEHGPFGYILMGIKFKFDHIDDYGAKRGLTLQSLTPLPHNQECLC